MFTNHWEMTNEQKALFEVRYRESGFDSVSDYINALIKHDGDIELKILQSLHDHIGELLCSFTNTEEKG